MPALSYGHGVRRSARLTLDRPLVPRVGPSVRSVLSSLEAKDEFLEWAKLAWPLAAMLPANEIAESPVQPYHGESIEAAVGLERGGEMRFPIRNIRGD